MAPAPPTIRPFRAADFARIDAIRAAAFRPVFALLRSLVGAEIAAVALSRAEADQQAHLRAICAPGSAHEVHVAVIDGELVAFTSLVVRHEDRVGEIDLSATHPDHQGRGIGTRLFACAAERMREQWMRVATVGTGGDPSHAAARRAYEKAGFTAAIPSVHLYRAL